MRENTKSKEDKNSIKLNWRHK